MAGFEVVVRPVVLPNIRPRPAQTLPPPDDPEQGFCTIKGNPAHEVTFSNSRNASMSKSHQVETQRRVDTARVYQQDDDGTVNRDNFVDVEVANKIWTRGGARPLLGANPVANPLGTDPATAQAAAQANEEIILWYQRQVEQQNIEIRKRDEIKKNQEAGE